MVRIAILRAGYGGLGLAFAAIAGSVYLPFLLLPGLLVALVAAFLLAFSDDDLPKWAGIVLLSYFGLTVLVFFAATPITIDKGEGYFVNAAPTAVAQEAFTWLGLAAPLMLAGAAILASWERETPARVLLFGAVSGFVVVGVLSVVLVPELASECEADPYSAECAAATQRTAAEGTQQGGLLRALSAVSALAGAVGTVWAAARPDEYA